MGRSVVADPTARAGEFQLEERRLRAAGEWKNLVDLYVERAQQLEESGQERMLYKAGEIATDELQDAALAEQLFMSAFRVRSSFMPAVGALRVLHQGNKNDAGLLEVMQIELDATEDGRRRAQLCVERAELQRKQDPEKALASYFEAIKAYPKSPKVTNG